MIAYQLTEPAIDDIDSMLRYLVPLNPSSAQRLAALFNKSFQLLCVTPYTGTISDEDDDVLIWHIPNTNYSIPYTFDGQLLTILRIFHQRQERPAEV